MLVCPFPDATNVLAIRTPGGFRLPHLDALAAWDVPLPPDPWVFDRWNSDDVTGILLEATTTQRLLERADTIGLTSLGRRTIQTETDVTLGAVINRCYHVTEWNAVTGFCGRCAAPNRRIPGEVGKRCAACGHVIYPTIAPAIIVAVVHDGKLLLARSARRTHGLLSVLAGFVEAGESIEHTVVREVQEESGLRVDNVRYFGSQPWPFPNQLMLAFTAEYTGGTLRTDDSEIASLHWFAPAEIPYNVPGAFTIAGRLIEWFVGEYGSQDDLRRIALR